jgi:transposase
MSQTPNTAIAVIGIDIGKNSFHVGGHDARAAIVLRQKLSRGQVEARLAGPKKSSGAAEEQQQSCSG